MGNNHQYNQDIDLVNLTQHYRSRATADIIHEAISDDECLSLNDINAIINTIDEDHEYEEDKHAITRMIVGSHPRIVSDDPMSSPTSLPSTNFSIETNDSQYSGFMKFARVKSAKSNKINQCEKEQEKYLEEKDEKEEENDDDMIRNAEEDVDVDALSLTVTYSNSIDDLNMIHDIKSVHVRRGSSRKVSVGSL